MKIILAKEPKAFADIKVLKDGVELGKTQGTSNKKEVTLSKEGKNVELNAGDVVTVMSYVYTATAAEVMAIGGEGVGRSFALYLEESVFNNDMAVIATKTTYFPRVVPESSFTMEGSSELAEQNMTYKFTVTKAEGEDALGYIYYVDAAAAAE